ncbi:MAG TPA: ABC transporter substrate-binding protein [Pelagibacterium sp.]|uniref:ABC transporter substrate-binding protein n=1 Tax=Pelagibacterium sp. TaxID=1967288 RepID=UPI002CDEBE40|nr:ABC transporter substrate-binding protein [Pelagibacterium sp.]HWJ87903.1 ABC transporter substrate-binding protein [Pelagibacterium sp.]
MKLDRFKLSLATAGMAMLAAMSAAPALAQTDLPEGVAALLEAAAAEGTVSLFVSTDARTAEDEVRLEEGIAKDLGIAIDIRLVSGSPDPVYIQQVVQQHNAGVEAPVDLFVTVPTLLGILNEAGAIAGTDWAALDANPDEIAEQVHGLFVAEFARPIFYNTNLLSAEEVPTSIEDLLREEWAGRIVTAALPDVFSPWAIGLGQDETLDMVETLFVDLRAGIAPAPTAIRTLVESGEYPIGFGIRISADQVANNSPVAYVPIKAPLVPRFAGVLEQSNNKNAATVVAWWLSQTEAGQALSAEVLDWPRHTTPGTDLFEMSQLTDGFYSAPAEWWMTTGVEAGNAIARLLQDI